MIKDFSDRLYSEDTWIYDHFMSSARPTTAASSNTDERSKIPDQEQLGIEEQPQRSTPLGVGEWAAQKQGS